MKCIDLKQQYNSYRTDVDKRMQAVLRHGQFRMGPGIVEVEQALTAYVGVKHCISVSSGKVSLEIALRALGIGPGNEVITAPFA